MSDELNRRDFMKRAGVSSITAGLAATGGAKAFGQATSAKPVPPSEKVRVGLIGAGRQGIGDMNAFKHEPEVEIVAVCDVYQPHLEKAQQAAGEQAKTYKDFRALLDDKSIDAVIIGSPDHWHPLQAILACQAGKDVYVEKPISVTVEEGKRMVEAARKYNRVVQVGTQQRSGIHFQKAVQLVQDGFIGKVSFVRTWNYGNDYPKGIGNPADSDPPADLDWNLWLGPAPKVPFNQNRFGVGDRWSTFRYFWDYAGGFMTDWGIHLIDIVQWAMKVDGPNVITALGGRFYLQDNADTPDTLQVTYEYPGFICTYENRWDNANSMYAHGYGIEFHGTEGTLFVDRGGFQVFPEKRRRADRKDKEIGLTASMQMDSINNEHGDHVRNFLDCMKTRKRPISDIEIGHRSTSTCLLGNVAYRSKERVVWDVAHERPVERATEARKFLTRDYRPPWKLAV